MTEKLVRGGVGLLNPRWDWKELGERAAERLLEAEDERAVEECWSSRSAYVALVLKKMREERTR